MLELWIFWKLRKYSGEVPPHPCLVIKVFPRHPLLVTEREGVPRLHDLWSGAVQSLFSSLQVLIISKETLSAFKSKHRQCNSDCQIISIPLRGLNWGRRSSVCCSEICKEKLVTRTWRTWKNNKEATAAESFYMGWCTVWFVGGHLCCSSHTYVLYLAHAMTMQPGTAWTTSFLDETTPKEVLQELFMC